jgi:hypothetical protein
VNNLEQSLSYSVDRAIAQEVSRRLHGFKPRSDHVGFVVDEMTLGQVPSSTSVSPANSHFTI